MVTSITERRDYPAYNLTEVIKLASEQQVKYASSTVFRDAENIGYSPDNVCECLCALTPECFRHSERYSEEGRWNDVYLMSYTGPARARDALYVKLQLKQSCICVLLISFHLQRQ